jgi:flavin-dependent dehydrogenase
MSDLLADALVIGGGVAGGALAAYLARAGRHVVVIERQGGPHDKVCGEFISAAAASQLRDLDVDLRALDACAVTCVRTCTSNVVASAPLPFAAFSLSRRALDEAILQRASAWGAQLRRGRAVQSLQWHDGRWVAVLEDTTTVTARTAFLATGKHDLRGFKRPPGRQNDLIGFKLHWRLAAEQHKAVGSAVELFLFPGGYAGLQAVEHGIANLCLVIRRGHFKRVDTRWDYLLPALRGELLPLHQRLEGGKPCWERPLAIAAIPYGYLRRPTAGRRQTDGRQDAPWHLGDQAAVIPSFAGEGIAIALYSAQLAATCYLDGRSQGEFQSRLADAIDWPLRSATLLSRILVHAPLQALAMALLRRAPSLISGIAQHTRIAQGADRSEVAQFSPGPASL